jgi:hypothetical protein
MYKISIPKPCHEDWNAMTPNEQGRHCNACAKTVVDFTAMSDEDVKYFFLHKNEKVCGRFMPAQLHNLVIDLPEHVFFMEMPLWKKFLLASLVIFGATLFSCNTSMNGQPIQPEELNYRLNGTGKYMDHIIVPGMIAKDTPPPPPQAIVGQLIIPPVAKIDPMTVKGDVNTGYFEPDTLKPKICNEPLMGVPVMEPPIVGEITVPRITKIEDVPKNKKGRLKKEDGCEKKTFN